jgi:hypothetical protein
MYRDLIEDEEGSYGGGYKGGGYSIGAIVANISSCVDSCTS